jgi:ABC-type uncharacterized transport system involved in gliding motility auxiliary subunit
MISNVEIFWYLAISYALFGLAGLIRGLCSPSSIEIHNKKLITFTVPIYFFEIYYFMVILPN